MLNKYISTTETALILNVSRITIFNWIKSGKIKSKKVAGNYLIDEAVVNKMLKPGFITDGDKILANNFINKLLKDYSEILKSNI